MSIEDHIAHNKQLARKHKILMRVHMRSWTYHCAKMRKHRPGNTWHVMSILTPLFINWYSLLDDAKYFAGEDFHLKVRTGHFTALRKAAVQQANRLMYALQQAK